MTLPTGFFRLMVAKALRKMQIASLRDCQIDKTARVMAWSQFSKVTMGRYSYCSYDCSIVECDIGAFCSIAANVAIGGSDHPIDFVSSSPVFCAGRNPVGKNLAAVPFMAHKRTDIGNDVWIGHGAWIRSGVTIGDGAVIGMGSVVTRDVAPYAIVVGNPARELRKRFSPEIIEQLLASRWWDLNDIELKCLGKSIKDPSVFLTKLRKN